ncbi:MAG: O-antigen ligase family protein, partial [Firmicutes bacterium]|nr:O-antigen ligase family protein [Bacillota bacterium]
GKRLAPWLTFAVFAAGVAIFVVGIGSGVGLNWFSQADGIYQHHDLASVFEYHNTFGAFELAVSLLALVAGLNYKRWWLNIFAAAAFTVAMAGVFGSYSREIWVMAPIGYLVALFLLGWIRRSYAPVLTSIVLLVLGGISTLLTLDALGKISQMRTLATQKTVAALTQSNALHGDVLRDVVLIFVVALIAGFGVPLFTRWLSGRRVTRVQGLGAVAVVVVAAVAVVYKFRHHLLSGTTSAATRLQSISLNSVSLQERFYYYKNAIAMWLNQPIFGAGGNTWSTKFQAFETNPYWSRQVHSVFFDQLLNGGIIGLLLWLAMLVFILIHVVRAIRAQEDASHKLLALGFLLAAGAMLAHGLFDFDFAFGYVQFLFFALLGLVAGTAVYRPAAVATLAAEGADPATRSSAAKERARRDQQQRGQRRKVMQGLAIAGTLVITVVAVVMGTSVSIAGSVDQQVAAAGQSLATDLGALQVGTWFAPYDANLELSLAQYDLSTAESTKQQSLETDAVAPLDAGAGYATWSPTELGRAAVLAYQMGNLPQALQWAQEAYSDAPFNTVAAGNVMGIAMWTGASELKSNHAAGVALEKQVVSTFRTFIARKNGVDLTLFPDAYAVYENTSMQVYMGTAEYLLGQYARSIKDLNPLINKGEDQAAVD